MGCATPTSRYHPHPKRSTTLCLPSLWSFRRPSQQPPPNIIHVRNDPPLYFLLLFGARDGLRHAHLQILPTSKTIHHSMFSFSLELATHTSRYSRYYQHPKRSTTLCLPSLWSLHPKRSTTLCLPSLWSLRRAVCHAHLQIIGNHISASPLTFRPSAPSLDRLYKRDGERGREEPVQYRKTPSVTKCVFSLFEKKLAFLPGRESNPALALRQADYPILYCNRDVPSLFYL